MRWTSVLIIAAALAVAACQPASEESDADFTSGPAPDALPAEEAATDASDVETDESDAPADPAQQSSPPPSETGDMGDARSGEESVEPDSPTMFQ